MMPSRFDPKIPLRNHDALPLTVGLRPSKRLSPPKLAGCNAHR